MKNILITFFTVLFCMTSSVGWGVTLDDLYIVEGKSNYRYYKKFTDVPYTGKITGKHQGYIKNGREEGFWISYWKNGRVFSKGSRKDNHKVGDWIYYWDNGQFRNKVNYINGKEEGYVIEYWKNGKVWKKGTYKNGKREGRWVYYHLNDFSLEKEGTGTYKNGVKISD
jgi:antitoxin component YwqK of YwqJK toxin-antitoxin module